MKLTHTTLSLTRFLAFFVLALVFSLSGCATDKRIWGFEKPSKPVPPIQVESKIVSDKEQDEEFEGLEPLISMDAEFLTLDLTENWNTDYSTTPVQGPQKTVFDFPMVMNKRVQMYLKLFSGKQKKQFRRWLEKSGRYKPMMAKEFAKAGLPKDLVYLSMIESGFHQKARSKSGAVGLWQFMKGTGKQYHLKIDKYVDERCDAHKSTKAAVAYLSDLYKDFGDWYLAVAAYNGGPGKIRSGLRRLKVDNFWDLSSKKHLRMETKMYVPKLIAALLIAKEPEKYGFSDLVYYKPLSYETITVGPSMNLSGIALISDSSQKEIKALNQELRHEKTPPNKAKYRANVPAGKAEIAKHNMSRLHSIATIGYKTHKIRKGDTLTAICKRYGINKTTLLKANNLHSNALPTGRNLRIPYSTVTYQLLPEGSGSAMAAYRDSLILHRIKKGESLSRIANKYKVSPEMIVAWNGLKNIHTIRAGQQLALYIDRKGSVRSKKKASLIKRNNKDLLVLMADKKKQRPGDKKSRFLYYNVRSGDSLWTISRRFRSSTSDIKKWNNLKSNLIHPGSKLKLKEG